MGQGSIRNCRELVTKMSSGLARGILTTAQDLFKLSPRQLGSASLHSSIILQFFSLRGHLLLIPYGVRSLLLGSEGKGGGGAHIGSANTALTIVQTLLARNYRG